MPSYVPLIAREAVERVQIRQARSWSLAKQLHRSGALRTSQRCRRRVLGRFAVHWEEITLRLRLSSCRGGMLSHNPTVDEHLPSPRVGIARKQKEIFSETYRLRIRFCFAEALLVTTRLGNLRAAPPGSLRPRPAKRRTSSRPKASRRETPYRGSPP